MEKLSRVALIELVNKIRDAEGHTEEENDAYLDIFLDNVPDPNATDYIYGLEYEELTSEEIVDKALSYRPFML